MVTALLHPATARKMQAKMPPQAHHDVFLRPLGSYRDDRMIVTMEDDNFIEAIFEDLKADDWADRLSERYGLRHRRGTSTLELGQPVHRRFQLALFEAYCLVPGKPPIDPAKITGSGLVVRRIDDRDDSDLGWIKNGSTIVGWRPLGGNVELDPDPAQRFGAAVNAPELLKIISNHRKDNDPLAEEILPLHVAPPDVCAARGKTILFGLIPVTSSERAGGNEDAINFADPDHPNHGLFVDSLSLYLTQTSQRTMPFAGQILSPESYDPAQNIEAGMNPLLGQAASGSNAVNYYKLGLFLQQLVVQLKLFDDSIEAAELREELTAIILPIRENQSGQVIETMNATDWIERAAPLLLEQEEAPGTLRMPLRWPAIDPDKRDALIEKSLNCMTRTYADLYNDTAKFESRDWRYRVRGFIRVSHGPECPTKLVWSQFSEAFYIVPWWDSDAPPTKISLPQLSDLKNIKPSVAFEMPPELANLLQRDPLDSMEGKGGEPSKIGLGWLCSFSIPIITICAFIVLNIFLSLFNLFFHWMMWIKVCLPIPVPQPPEEGS